MNPVVMMRMAGRRKLRRLLQQCLQASARGAALSSPLPRPEEEATPAYRAVPVMWQAPPGETPLQRQSIPMMRCTMSVSLRSILSHHTLILLKGLLSASVITRLFEHFGFVQVEASADQCELPFW